MNTGIQDVHNLCWKLALVLGGVAAESLLEGYEAERLPVGRRNVEQSFQFVQQFAREDFGADFNTLGYILGTSYESTAIVPDGTELPAVPKPPGQLPPDSETGVRAPHIWLERNGEHISTIDLFDGVYAAGGCGWSRLVSGRKSRRQAALHIPAQLPCRSGRRPERHKSGLGDNVWSKREWGSAGTARRIRRLALSIPRDQCNRDPPEDAHRRAWREGKPRDGECMRGNLKMTLHTKNSVEFWRKEARVAKNDHFSKQVKQHFETFESSPHEKTP